jgi:hypothetical protein
VIRVDAWRKQRSAPVRRPGRRLAEVDIDDRAASGEHVRGSDEWWVRALRAFQAYIELRALQSGAGVDAVEDREKET